MVDGAAFLARARSLAGLRVASLMPAVPATQASPRTSRHKGGVGNAIERALGLEPSSAAGPDVPELALEVKTLPVDDGRILESTWVCSASPESMQSETWATSRVRAKLACVLFVPVEAGRVPLEERRVGTPFLWSPDGDDEDILRHDWEDLADLVAHGLGFAVSARRGKALQLRPKAASARVRRTAVDVEGERYQNAPQGFYLRRSFTQRLLAARFVEAA